MSDEQPQRRYASKGSRACVFTVEADTADEAQRVAAAQAGESPVFEGAKWEVRRLNQ